MPTDRVSTLAAQLDDLAGTGADDELAGGAATPPAKTLICQNAQASLREAERDLAYYRNVVKFITAVLALFIIASLYVLIRFIQGDAPRAAVDKVVFAVPIAGSIVTGVAMNFIMKQRSKADSEVEELTGRFDRTCKGVLAE